MFSAPSCWQYIHIAGIQINREIEKRHMGEVNKCLLTLSLNGLWYLDFLIQIQDALRHITTIPLEQRFMEKLDQNWPRWWRLKEERVLSSNHFWTSWLRFVVLVQLLACYLCGEIQTQSKVLEVGPSPSKLGGGPLPTLILSSCSVPHPSLYWVWNTPINGTYIVFWCTPWNDIRQYILTLFKALLFTP